MLGRVHILGTHAIKAIYCPDADGWMVAWLESSLILVTSLVGNGRQNHKLTVVKNAGIISLMRSLEWPLISHPNWRNKNNHFHILSLSRFSSSLLSSPLLGFSSRLLDQVPEQAIQWFAVPNRDPPLKNC